MRLIVVAIVAVPKSAASSVVILVALARLVLDVRGTLARFVRIVSADTHHQLVR